MHARAVTVTMGPESRVVEGGETERSISHVYGISRVTTIKWRGQNTRCDVHR